MQADDLILVSVDDHVVEPLPWPTSSGLMCLRSTATVCLT